MATKNIADHIRAEIRAEMARQKKTQTELGYTLHISQRAASYRLNGERTMDWEETALAAKWLGLSLSELVIRAEEAARAQPSAA